MFFHVDESGHTGNNLFDENQPRLSYGLLSSKTNVDVLGKGIHKEILQILNIDSIHANILGVRKLTKISSLLLKLQKKMKFDFDCCYIDKPVYALVILFDALFDPFFNKAVRPDVYWTPMRFIVILNMSTLFDNSFLKIAWELCIHKKIESQEEKLISFLKELQLRTEKSDLDSRSKEVITESIQYGLANPLRLDFGVKNQKEISPNIVCFQFIISAMAVRLRKKNKKNASAIIVDRQSQFNKAQKDTHGIMKIVEDGIKRASYKDRDRYLSHPLFDNYDKDLLARKGIPKKNITILSSEKSIGLQIVDVYLWIINRLVMEKELSRELRILASEFIPRGMADGISMEKLVTLWKQFESQLPDLTSLTREQSELFETFKKEHREKVSSL